MHTSLTDIDIHGLYLRHTHNPLLMPSLVEVDFWKLRDCTGSYALYVTESALALCRLHCQENSTSEILSKVFCSNQELNLGPPPNTGRCSTTELWLTLENIAFRSAIP